MLGLSPDQLAARRVFFFPFERRDESAKLSNDLQLAKEHSLIPLYVECLPESEEVESVVRINMLIPVIPAAAKPTVRGQIVKVKQKFLRLFSATDNDKDASAILAEIAADFEELESSSGATDHIGVTAHLLRYSVRGATETHPALVRQEGRMNVVSAPGGG